MDRHVALGSSPPTREVRRNALDSSITQSRLIYRIMALHMIHKRSFRSISIRQEGMRTLAGMSRRCRPLSMHSVPPGSTETLSEELRRVRHLTAAACLKWNHFGWIRHPQGWYHSTAPVCIPADYPSDGSDHCCLQGWHPKTVRRDPAAPYWGHGLGRLAGGHQAAVQGSVAPGRVHSEDSQAGEEAKLPVFYLAIIL